MAKLHPNLCKINPSIKWSRVIFVSATDHVWSSYSITGNVSPFRILSFFKNDFYYTSANICVYSFGTARDVKSVLLWRYIKKLCLETTKEGTTSEKFSDLLKKKDFKFAEPLRNVFSKGTLLISFEKWILFPPFLWAFVFFDVWRINPFSSEGSPICISFEMKELNHRPWWLRDIWMYYRVAELVRRSPRFFGIY